MADPHLSPGVSTECIPNTTTEDDVSAEVITDVDEEDSELLQRLATRHYYSYTAALGVTVGVGCLLLVLNMLIFAGIYYQRDRDRKRQNQNNSSNRPTSSPSCESIPMSQRPLPTGSSSRPTSPIANKVKHEPPPCYATLPRSAQDHAKQKSKSKAAAEKFAPPPPVRTSSNPPGGTIKKRVQIQEISV